MITTKKELAKKYEKLRPAIESRLSEFATAGAGDANSIFVELSFCLLTPQSKARAADKAISKLLRSNLLYSGEPSQIAPILKKCGVRFANKKSSYICKARGEFFSSGGFAAVFSAKSGRHLRNHLAQTVLGLGYKESSHFLRNIGRGNDLAILDRHILANLKGLGVIRAIPPHMSANKYLHIEKRVEKFSQQSGIPLSHLDLLFWAEQTGEIFK